MHIFCLWFQHEKEVYNFCSYENNNFIFLNWNKLEQITNWKLEQLRSSVISELLGKTYGIAKLPYGIIVCEKGMIVSLGVVNSREHLDSLFEAKESKIASIQDYLKKN